VLDFITRVVACDAAVITLIEEGEARVMGNRRYKELGLEEFIQHIRLKVDETPTLRWMVENKRPLYVADTQSFAGWVPGWQRSYVGAPIMIEGQVIGFLNLDSAMPGAFNAADADHLQAFANQAGIAIRNARYHEALQRYATELEARVMERTAELELERSQLRAILDAMSEGVIFIDMRGKTRYLNQALCEITGYGAEQWQDARQTSLQLSMMDETEFAKFTQTVNAALEDAGIWQGSAKIRQRTGRTLDVGMTCNRVNEPDGRVAGVVVIIRDISQEKALEEQKSRFVARASHELRTPLTNLKTRLYLIDREPQRFDEHIEVIRHVTARMERLVEDLLDVSRFERGLISLRRRETLLQTLVQDVVHVQQPEADAKDLHLRWELPPEPLIARVDPDRILQVITNLVNNSIKFTPAHGRVTVSMTVNIRHELEKDSAYAVISVEDSGIGIAPEHLAFLFQPFFRVDENTRGTGLGLSISREIIELHDGHIEVESKVGEGTRFDVYLPLATVADGVT
jgi:two-component system phosphate regulon sensor histidine kinase PhoR